MKKDAHQLRQDCTRIRHELRALEEATLQSRRIKMQMLPKTTSFCRRSGFSAMVLFLILASLFPAILILALLLSLRSNEDRDIMTIFYALLENIALLVVGLGLVAVGLGSLAALLD